MNELTIHKLNNIAAVLTPNRGFKVSVPLNIKPSYCNEEVNSRITEVFISSSADTENTILTFVVPFKSGAMFIDYNKDNQSVCYLYSTRHCGVLYNERFENIDDVPVSVWDSVLSQISEYLESEVRKVYILTLKRSCDGEEVEYHVLSVYDSMEKAKAAMEEAADKEKKDIENINGEIVSVNKGETSIFVSDGYDSSYLEIIGKEVK